ncbi:putative Beta-galactosidase [Streptomyces viridochromogenes Tue57]|uniref:beta-galactosidase n=1 Tax=Streptomyces viridochromogenes Tue57 TaxID=1160705 RepID=L8PPR1_STRVR|nr:putative Beta-galactosidase [Streptomyces viridochromogenes Tue57]
MSREEEVAPASPADSAARLGRTASFRSGSSAIRPTPRTPRRRNALAHVAHGADGIAYFQWRAAKAGAEQWHSAMLPHAGTDSRIWQDVVQLGADLRALAEVHGSTSPARVAIVWEWNARWAMELPCQPSSELRFQDLVRHWYTPLWRAGVAVDFVRPDSPDLDRYQLVLAPSLYLVDDAGAADLAAFVERGGTLAVGFHSGAVDENCHIRLGGYPGAFREILGVHGDELFPLLPGQSVGLTGQVPQDATADLWTERIRLTGAEAVATYADGTLAGVPAITRHTYGGGTAWYLATHPDPTTLAAALKRICLQAGVRPKREVPAGVEVVRRRGADADYLFLIDHAGHGAEIPAEGVELLTGKPVTVPEGGVAVVREPRAELRERVTA